MIEIKNRNTSEVLLTHECDSLIDANLRYANLRSSDLRYANLRYADLRGANLRSSDLRSSDLRYADLENADLENADLRYAIGNNSEVKTIQASEYVITYTEKIINIGCQSHTKEKWFNFTDDQILKMDGERALNWWKKWKPILKSILEFEEN